MRKKLLGIILLEFVFLFQSCSSKLFYPPIEYIAINKPLDIHPTGSTCGLELKDTLCDNRLQDPRLCANATFFCDQSCPFGNVLENLSDLKQTLLENMNPCVILKDFGYLLVKSSSTFSYFFDKNSNLCETSEKISSWKPFSLENDQARPILSFYNSRTSSLDIFNSGLTITCWFRQFPWNNGTLFHLVRDDNQTVLVVNIKSSIQKIYLNYICSDLNSNQKDAKLCYVELNATRLQTNVNSSNFLALKIYKNVFNLFINEPTSLQNIPAIEFNLTFDLGSYITLNKNKLNYYVGNDIKNELKYYGWIQDFRVFLISLVNIEILELFDKSNTYVSIQSECRCTNSYPRNENKNSAFCKSNENLPEYLQKKVPRLNNLAHPLGYLNDDDFSTSWISCILTITNPISIILDLLNGEYIVQRIEIYFTSLPPTELVIERFYKEKWTTVQFYSVECVGSNSVCVQLPKQFSNEAFGGYTIVWSSGSTNDMEASQLYSNISFLESLKASKIRISLRGYYSVVKSDLRQLYYSISELKVKGSCDCNGYSSSCNIHGKQYQCDCEANSFTKGSMCNECEPMYNNKKYQSRYNNVSAMCDMCSCNNRSTSCFFDQNSNTGVCNGCQKNTGGNNCEKCASNYFSIQKTPELICSKCNCDLEGVFDLKEPCDRNTGKCLCKINVDETRCDKCKLGFWNFSKSNPLGCTKCDCDPQATIPVSGNLTMCDEKTGQCKCKSNFVQGFRCDSCVESMYNLENGCMSQCNCNAFGSLNPVCNQVTGRCVCKPNIGGLKCDLCLAGFYNLTLFGCINKCECDQIGSINSSYCDSITGQCGCKPGYTGKNCDKCLNGYWRSGSKSECTKCLCSLKGISDSNNICDQKSGKCNCNSITQGFNCDECIPGYWGLPGSAFNGCEKCECDEIGTDPNSLQDGNYVCNRTTSQCACKPNRIGLKCESCGAGYFYLGFNGIDCLTCDCDAIGTIPGSTCDPITGECTCKVASGVGGTRCDDCMPNFFNFSRTTGSCSTCDCNLAGSLDQECDLVTGDCNCKTFVTGAKCSQCIPGTSNLDIINPYGCSKSPSKQSPPLFEVLTAKSLNVKWEPPDYPNGIIRYYLVFRNDSLISNTTDNVFEDKNLEPFVTYSYKIQAFNDEGNASSRYSFISIILPSTPCCKFMFNLFNVRSTEADLVWSIPEKLNGLEPFYLIGVYTKIDISKPLTESNLIFQKNSSLEINHFELMKTNLLPNNQFETKLEHLLPYTQYFISVKTCNKDLQDPKNLFCLTGMPKNTINNSFEDSFYSLVTSQDRPEYQSPPIIVSLNSSYVVVGVSSPLRPNGIILLYEIWIRPSGPQDGLSSLNSQNLVCAIEDLYDPNNLNSIANANKTKICIIKNLKPNNVYYVSASSSNLIGRSPFSSELEIRTYENAPICPPQIITTRSNESDNIYFKWNPTFEESQSDPLWINCIGGMLKNFTIYEIGTNKTIIIYSGLENEFFKTQLTFSTVYYFKIELCNGVGCAVTDIFSVKTLDPPPNPWRKTVPKYELVNSSFIKFDWSSYMPFNITENARVDRTAELFYRLERSEISFAWPPPPLENGIRFHGFNYYVFNSPQYFPEGYPYFGLKYFYKTKINSSLIYFAPSSFAQNELTVVQMLNGIPWFLSNTLSSELDTCSIYLAPENIGIKLTDQAWHSFKTFRLNNFAYIDSAHFYSTYNSSECKNQVLTDLNQGIFLGGLPDNFLSRDESQYAGYNYKLIQRRKFVGCLKNLSTVLEIEDIPLTNTSFPKVSTIDFDFMRDAKLAPGEPIGSNFIEGCPINLENTNNTLHFLGFGFLFVNMRQTIPVIYQTNKYFIVDVDLRTEWSQGILFLNYDIDNNQLLLIRFLDSNYLEVNLRSRVKYDDIITGDSNYFSFYMNRTFFINNLNNGYWLNLKIALDFVSKDIRIISNNTLIESSKLITNITAPKNVFDNLQRLNLTFTYYTDVLSYYGGYNMTKIDKILNDLSINYEKGYITLEIFKFYTFFFNFLKKLDINGHFTGCIKNFKINTFSIDFSNLNNIVYYQNVRFDGCSNLKNFNLKNSLKNFNFSKQKITTVYEGNSNNNVFDSNFNSFTEYFYRVVAFNTEGSSNSEWFLVRTPEDQFPLVTIDLKYLRAEAVSGYKILVQNMTNFCYYCDSKSNEDDLFTGITQKFILNVKEFDKSYNDYMLIKNYTFSCDTVCFQAIDDSIGSVSEYFNFLRNDFDSNALTLYIDTTPITKYSLSVSVCNRLGCTESEQFLLVTLEEAPDGVYAPTLASKTSNSLLLKWNIPKFPSGYITGYILRLIDGDKETIVYFGLQREFDVTSLKSLTNYTFSLEACNSRGCGRSSKISYVTDEMAPLSVSPPILVNITENSIALKWNKPNNDQIIGGYLTGYILYVSQVDEFYFNTSIYNETTCAECSSNIKILTNLTSGTEYIVILSACTNGGCTNSSELKVTTLESFPNVDDIVITTKERNATSLGLSWTKPRRPNGKPNKYVLYQDDRKVFEGLSNNYTITNLDPNNYFLFYIVFCNNFFCSSTKSHSVGLKTDEALPSGSIILEAEAAGPNQIQLKWFSEQKDPLVPNGEIIFSVFINGPYLIEFESLDELQEIIQSQRPFLLIETLNLLNTSVYNTKYGIFDRILPYSTYMVQVNASNSKGFILSNQVKVETFKSIPDLVISPVLLDSNSTSLKIEWYNPILINSEDRTVFFQVDYKTKYLWNSEGTINQPIFEKEIKTLFKNKTLATTFTLTNLTPSSAYSFQLIASNTYGQSKSEWSVEYLTKEERPKFQDPPLILNFTSKSVYISWRSPLKPNGDKQLESIRNITVSANATKEFNVTELESFTLYVFSIESCNSYDCAVSELYGKTKSFTLEGKAFIRTDPSEPELFEKPILNSSNSYSINITWKLPLKPNGQISFFILERFDYSLPLNIKLNSSKTSTNQTIKYRFEPHIFSFVDYENLEACGLYSYRVLAFNQIGNVSTPWVNVTVTLSKPLIVTSPIVNFIDSQTARFEWMKPLTYCDIKTYTLRFRSELGIAFDVDVDNSNITTQSIIVNDLIPFTVYDLQLIACVNLEKDGCTQSLVRKFQTNGDVPKGLSIPVARLISYKTISIEWLEPIYKNGKSVEYQVVRALKYNSTVIANKTETVYFGSRNYFLDSTVKINSLYYYRIVYSNEFGNALSDWSNEIQTPYEVIDEEASKNKTSQIIRVLFDLKSECLTPNSIKLDWKTFTINEILNFIKTYDSSLKMDNTNYLYNLVIKNSTIQIRNLNHEYEFLVSNSSSSNEIDSQLIEFLKPSVTYEFKLNLYFVLEILNSTQLLSNKTYIFQSEQNNCTTMSITDAFGEPFLGLKSNIHLEPLQLNVTYKLSQFILENYVLFSMNLNKIDTKTNFSNLVESKKFVQPSGLLRFEPILFNVIYEVYIKACFLPITNSSRHLVAPSIFMEFNCIESLSSFYSLSSAPPQNISDLSVSYVNSSLVKLNWQQPQEPNGYLLDYLVYRRGTCFYDFKKLQQCPLTESEKVCCKGVFYNKKVGFECCDTNYLDTRVLYGFANFSLTCCGGKFYRTVPNYECCGDLFYVNVPPGQICCNYRPKDQFDLKEVRIGVGFGDLCCLDVPYFRNGSQKCCNSKIVSINLKNFALKNIPILTNHWSLLDKNKCSETVLTKYESTCENFDLKFNKTSAFSFEDTTMLSFESYEYKICVANTFNTTCNPNILNVQTKFSKPKDFSYFNYEVLGLSRVFLYWNSPLQLNGQFKSYILFRNEKEIYTGANQFYYDETRDIQPYKIYKYSIKFCNQAECIFNEKSLFVSTNDRLPEQLEAVYFEITNTSIALNFKYPFKPNGFIDKFVLSIKELSAEILVFFVFDSNRTMAELSANFLANEIYFSADSIFDKKITYSINLLDLLPNTEYNIKLSACNKAGCVKIPTSLSLFDFTSIVTRDYFDFEVKSPVVYVIDDSSTEIVWHESNIMLNSLQYKIYRDNVEIIEFNKSTLSANLGFLSYLDKNLTNNSFYSYKTAIVCRNLTKTSQSVLVQTSPAKFDYNCSSKRFLNYSKSVYNAMIPLLNILFINFTVNNSNEISIEYKNDDWKSFIACISKINYQNIDLINQSIQSDKTAFSIKILLENSFNGLQSLDFPYPPIKYEKNLIKYFLTGLSAYSNYSIRISFSSNYPIRQVLTTEAIYLQTFEDNPCCSMKPPKIVKQPFSKIFSIRWSRPEFSNGIIKSYILVRAKLKGRGCIKFDVSEVDLDNIEKQTRYELFPFDAGKNPLDTFSYDSTNEEFIYKDSESVLLENFAYFTYKIIAINSKGILESSWSDPVLSWQLLKPPTPPLDLKITEAYSTGFKLKFKEPLNFNGIISFYTIKIKELATLKLDLNKIDTQELIIEPINNCTSSNLFVEIPISGLRSFKSYKIAMIATNQAGLSSNESEEVVANTMESTPFNIGFLSATPFENNMSLGIRFKFEDPYYLNGVITSFNLYEFKNVSDKPKIGIFYDNELTQIYSGNDRVFIYSDLKPYTNYSFIFEVCTYFSCARKIETTTVLTLESLPMNQSTPVLTRINQTNCFEIKWSWPLYENGKILYFELHKIKKLVENLGNETISTINITNFTHLNPEKYIDCDLKPNYIYSYKILSFNSRGYAESNLSRSIVIGQGKPSGFNISINALQINESVVEVYFSRPLQPNGQIIAYNIFRNNILLSNGSDIHDFDSATKLSYRDIFEFIPNQIYIYVVYVCNELGCSTDLEKYSFSILINDQPPLVVNRPLLIELNVQKAVISASNCVILKSPKTQKIVEYRFYLNNTLINKGQDSTLYLSNLESFTIYEVKLEACTFVSTTRNCCLASNDMLLFQTNQSSPSSLRNIEFKDSIFNEFFLSVELSFQLPQHPNGILRLVKLKRDDSFDVFSSTNMSILSFVDKGLKYGQNYTYELTYYNDAGFSSIKNWHLTEENLPYSVNNIKCGDRTSSDIEIEVSEPLFPNGVIKKFEVKFKKASDQIWTTLNNFDTGLNRSSIYSLKISQLSPFTQYEFQAIFCNSRGCIKSNITSDKNCITSEGVPIGVMPPECTELSNENSEKIVVLIKWEPPLQANGAIIEYTLYRVTIQTSITYDSNYNFIDDRNMDSLKKELYTGRNLSFIDFNVGAYSTYDYFIAVKTSAGSSISPYARYETRAMPPLFLKIGELVSFTNHSAILNLKPPLYINGRLKSAFILVMSKNFFQEREIYPGLNILTEKNFNAKELLNYLTMFSLENLKANSNYEIKTKFCNQVDCLTSFESIKFTTLDNNRFVFFNADAINNGRTIELKWKFNFGNINETKFVKYHLRGSINSTFVLLYEGLEDHFLLENALPYANYEFEIFAYTYEEGTFLANSKAITLLTPSEKPLFKSFPNVAMYGNETKILKLNWKNVFNLNGPLKKYELFVNNRSVYEGNRTFFEIELNDTNCAFSENKFDSTYLTITIKAIIDFYESVSPAFEVPINCTSETDSNFMKYHKSTSFESWLVVILFLSGFVLLIAFISIVICILTSFRKNSPGVKLNKDLQKVSFTDDLKYIDDSLDMDNNSVSEKARQSADFNPSLKELIDFQYKFNHNSAPNFSINKIIDYNKSKDLKNINDFKLKQLDDIFDNDFNDLDEELFELKNNMSVCHRPILIEEKVYDNSNNSHRNEDCNESKEGSYI